MLPFEINGSITVKVSDNYDIADIIHAIEIAKNKDGLSVSVLRNVLSFKNCKEIRISSDKFAILGDGFVSFSEKEGCIVLFYNIRISKTCRAYIIFISILCIMIPLIFCEYVLYAYLLGILSYLFLGNIFLLKFRYKRFLKNSMSALLA